MPKLKTHKGTAKRVRITSNKKVIRKRANGIHFLAKKSSARKRVINTAGTITGKLANNIKRALGV